MTHAEGQRDMKVWYNHCETKLGRGEFVHSVGFILSQQSRNPNPDGMEGSSVQVPLQSCAFVSGSSSNLVAFVDVSVKS